MQPCALCRRTNSSPSLEKTAGLYCFPVNARTCGYKSWHFELIRSTIDFWISKMLNDEARKKAVGYVRVSKQSDKGVSLEAQAEKIRAMACVHDAEVEIVADDGETGKHANRPGLQQVLEMMRRREVELVIVAKLDRLTRSVKDLAELLELFRKRNVSLVSVAESLNTGSAGGRLVMNLLVSVGQWEREAIGERTATALRHKRTQGRVFNHEPFGFQRSGDELVPLPAEQSVIATMKAWRDAGWTLRAIASALNLSGTPTKRGAGKWHAQTVKDIVESDLHGREAA
jgi:site-specific DNA recombinase